MIAVVPQFTWAQLSEPKIKSLNDEKYLYPINPGAPGSLAGNMGELRSTHFHSGIDIRTNNMVGLKVYASKSGYVSRAIISTAGYGNVLYITHPDGNTTLYAHLDVILGALGDSVRRERYNRKVSEIDLTFPENKFQVRRGDIIALSGNTGGSQGPHLHFDIRDKNNNALNPLQFGFPELSDKMPPAAEKIAFQTLDINSRINDCFGRFEFYVQKVGKNYVLPQPILARGNIGIEILAKDKFIPKGAFYGGVNYLNMKVDSQLVFSQSIEKLDLAETRNIYTLTSFKTMRTKGTRFYKMYIDDGNDLKFYDKSPGKGKIYISETKGRDTQVQIGMKDSYGNSSLAQFSLRPNPLVKQVVTLEPMKTDIFFDVTENVLMVVARPCSDSLKVAQVFTKGSSKDRQPDYFNLYRSVYLFDLRKEIPDSVVVCGASVAPKIKVGIPSNTEYKYYDDRMDVEFPINSLYDTLYLNTDHAIRKDGSEIFTVGSRVNPLNKSIRVSLKPVNPISWTTSTAVYRTAGRGFSYVGGEKVNNQIQFATREFGDFVVLDDNIPPTIKVIYINGQSARFRIKDALSGISSFEATLNGEWLLMNYDYKTGIIKSEKLNDKIALKGAFELVVTDNAGNKKTFNYKIP